MNYITNRESAYPNRINIPIADEDANVTFLHYFQRSIKVIK